MNNDFQVLLEIYKGNTAAVDVIRMFVHIANVWDDLIDDDPVAPGDIHMAFCNCLVGLNANPFFRAHAQRLTVSMRTGILNWLAANEMEKSPGIPREIAHVARYAAGDIAIDIAEIIGGFQWAVTHAPTIKLMMIKESYAAYDKEMEARYGKPN